MAQADDDHLHPVSLIGAELPIGVNAADGQLQLLGDAPVVELVPLTRRLCGEESLDQAVFLMSSMACNLESHRTDSAAGYCLSSAQAGQPQV